LHQMYHRLRNHFGCSLSYSYATRLKWKLVWVQLEIILIVMQDRSMVYAECTIRIINHFGHTR
jgi:hypothetical protein